MENDTKKSRCNGDTAKRRVPEIDVFHKSFLFVFSLVLTFPEAVQMLKENGVEIGDEDDLR